MKNYVTPHTEECEHDDNSQVIWDPESGVSACADCGAVTEEHDTEVETQMLPEVGE